MPSSFESHEIPRALPVVQGECAHVPMSSVQPLFCVWHVPFVHVPLHVMPQPPQLALSLPIVSTQLPAQQLVVPHDVPQPPQLFGSVVMSTHELLQHVLCVPRQEPPHGCVLPLSCCCVPESCFGVPESCLGVPESVFGPESTFDPESIGDESSAAVPVAQRPNKTQNHAAAPTTRMTPSPA
jgi:hypothetical protein